MKFHQKVDFNNITKFHGITKPYSGKLFSKKACFLIKTLIIIHPVTISTIFLDKEYLLVMEYAEGGTLRNYLEENFPTLNWQDKYKLSLQLSSAVEYLHE